MPNYKNARQTEDIHRELTAIFRTLKDPRIDPMLSVIHVELSRDGSACKVFVSSLQGIEKAKESVKGLKSAAGFIRHEIGMRLEMRCIPEFTFIADDSIEHGARIAQIINELHDKEN